MMQRYKIKGDSQVGYKRPPVESRFKKGQSGNPQGRRRRRPATVAAILADELQSTVVINENGRRLKVQRIQVLIKEAVNQATKGNFQPLVLITKILGSLEQLNSTATRKNLATDPPEEEFSNLSDDELYEQIKQEIAEIERKRSRVRVKPAENA
jgi:hypothetical protein